MKKERLDMIIDGASVFTYFSYVTSSKYDNVI
jgi:hypothetical protein